MAEQFGAGKDGAGAPAASEDDLLSRQGAKLYPVGRALRASFDADNHASLSKDVTGLMLDLARVPFEPHEFEPLPPVQRPPPPPPRLGWVARARLAIARSRART